METKPASAPFPAAMVSHTKWPVLPAFIAIDSPRVLIVPAAAARVVVTAHKEATGPEPMIASAEPGLNPYHPNHKMKTPRRASEAECPGISLACKARQ